MLIEFNLTCVHIPSFIHLDNCDCRAESIVTAAKDVKKEHLRSDDGTKPKMAILVPLRDRFDELEFAPHMTTSVSFHIFVLNQIDRYRFNRASLINVGYLYTKSDYDYIAMYDVDLLPLNPSLHYGYPKDGPFHIAAPKISLQNICRWHSASQSRIFRPSEWHVEPLLGLGLRR